MKDIVLFARFPEQRYCVDDHQMEIEVKATGGTLAIAIKKAMQAVMNDPRMKRKSPNYVMIEVAVGGICPLRYLPKLEDRKKQDDAAFWHWVSTHPKIPAPEIPGVRRRRRWGKGFK